MANVSFYRQTTPVKTAGAITFDTDNKKIYLGAGSAYWIFDGNYPTYSNLNNTVQWGTSTNIGYLDDTPVSVTMPTRPNLKVYNEYYNEGVGINAFNGIHDRILDFLNDSSSSEGKTMYIDFVVESWVALTNYKDANYFSSAGRFVIPYHGWGFHGIDEANSDRDDAVNIVSTPVVIGSSTSVQSCLIVLTLGGSTRSGEWTKIPGSRIVTPTNVNTSTDVSLPNSLKVLYSYHYGE